MNLHIGTTRGDFLGSVTLATSLCLVSAALAQSVPLAPPPPGDSDAAARGGDRPGQSDQGQRRQRGQDGAQGDRGGRGGRGGGGGGGMMGQFTARFRPDFTRRDADLFQEQLELDQGQMAVVEALIEEYDFQYTPASEAARQEVSDLGREMFRNLMGGGDMRERMRGVFESAQADLDQLTKEKGGEIDEETRRKFYEERMKSVGEQIAADRAANGGDKLAHEALEKITEKVTAWVVERNRMKAEVIDGIRTVLTDEQKASWPKFERYLRRERLLDQGTLSGERVNMFVVLDESELPQADIDRLAKSLDAYELALDGALVAREEFREQAEPKMFKAVLDADRAEVERILNREYQLRRLVRDANDQARQAIAAELGQVLGLAFADSALEAGYRNIFRSTLTERTLTAALEIEGLDPRTVEAIRGLQTQYTLALAGINDSLLIKVRESESADRVADGLRIVDSLTGAGMPMFGGGGRQGAEDPARPLYEKRAELGNSTLEQLMALLTPDQVALLPNGGEDRERVGGRGGQMGGMMFGGGGQGGRGGLGGNGPVRIDDMPESMRDRVRSFDKNNDGTLDETERDAAFQDFRQRRQGGDRQQTPEA